MDYTGKGQTREQDFMNNLVIQRSRFDKKDIREMLYREDYFLKDKSSNMGYDVFKKAFFP